MTQSSAPAATSNFKYNQQLWDRYAREWNQSNRKIHIEDPRIAKTDRHSYLTHLGDEWGKKQDVDRVVAEYILPYITPESVVAEIGSGGARVASRIAAKPKELWCFDISREMLKRATEALDAFPRTRFVLLNEPRFPGSCSGRFDFVYSFDVFLHLDLHTIWKYLNEIRRALKSGGHTFLHLSNLASEPGWERFASQDDYSADGFYFISPEIADLLIERSGLRKIKASSLDPTNFYFKRDYLVVLQKE